MKTADKEKTSVYFGRINSTSSSTKDSCRGRPSILETPNELALPTSLEEYAFPHLASINGPSIHFWKPNCDLIRDSFTFKANQFVSISLSFVLLYPSTLTKGYPFGGMRTTKSKATLSSVVGLDL